MKAHLDSHPRDLAAIRRQGALLLLMWIGLAGLAIAVGSRLTGATGPDHRISMWFEDHRTGVMNTVTNAFSVIAGTFEVVGIALVVIVVGLIRRKRAALQVLVVGLIGEVTMFLLITAVVDRSRPDVIHLDPAPPTSSFPSGHTFATFVLWTTIAVVAVGQDWPTWLRRLTRVLAIALPISVALSRVYRGMHHPTDVVAALVLGVLWVVAVVAVLERQMFSRASRRLPESRRVPPTRPQPGIREYTS